jgi:pectin methylesterase-like acyl-CoA thioesterase
MTVYSYNKQVYPNLIEIDIINKIGITPAYIDYNLVTYDISVYFYSPLSAPNEVILDGIIADQIYVDSTSDATFYNLTAANANIVNITGVTITATNLLSGTTNIDEVFSPMVHTHSVSAITDLETYYLPKVSAFTEHLITVGKSGNVQFTSIKDAVDSITGNSASSRYIVKVAPGIYVEDTITMKSYVSLEGDSYISTVIEVDSTSKDIIIGADQSMISDVTLRGATGVGKSAIVYASASGIATGFLNVESVRFGTNYTFIKSMGLSGSSCSVQCSNIKFGIANYNTGFIATYSGSGSSTIQLRSISTTAHEGAALSPSNFAIADGSGSQIVCNSAQINRTGVVTGSAFKAINGGSIRLTAVNMRNWGIGIEMPNSGASTNISGVALNFENNTEDINVTHPTATGKIDNANLLKTTIIESSSVNVLDTDFNTIKVRKKGGDFNSIKDAVDYITGSSETNRYTIEIGPGVFYEDEIDLSTKTFISLVGSNIQSTQIIPNNSNHHIIKIGNNNEVSFLSLSGAGAGYAGIYCYDIGDFAQVHKVSFTDCDTGIWVESNTQDTYFYGEYLDFEGVYSYGTKLIANNNYLAFGNFENYYNFPLSTGNTICNFTSGSGSSLNMLASGIVGNSSTGLTGVYIEDSAYFDVTSFDIDGCHYAIHVGNVGSGSTFDIDSISITNSGLYDLYVEHPDTVGSIQGSASHQKINNASIDVSWVLLDTSDGELDITRKLSVTFQDNTHTDLSTLIFEGSTMGLMSGGEITFVSGLTVNISAGYGYLEKYPDVGIVKRIDWNSTNYTMTSGSTKYLYINENGTLSSSTGKPDSVYNIILGRVITNGQVELIDVNPVNASHTSNKYSNLLSDAIGPIFANGTVVTENVTPLHLDISAGKYYLSSNEYSPTGGTNVTFVQYSRNGLSDWDFSSTTVVNNTHYDNNGTLTPLSGSYYTKHTLYVLGDGQYETYLLVIGQNQYASLVETEDALLATPPNYFTDGITQIANIYVQQGVNSIVEIEDIKPVIGFRAGGVNASSVHGNLLGLDADDHTQYLLVNGGRAMSGNLNMDTNNIISAGTINGVTIQTHASRHLPNGSDPLTTAIASNIQYQNAIGTANSFARSDHKHAHSALSGGTLHAVATTSINGFMSSVDKTYLDSVPTKLSQKAFLSGATFTGIITTPTISATTYQGNVITSATTVGAGIPIFKQKSGNNLEIRSISAGSNITITTGDTLTISSTGGSSSGSSRTTGSTTTTNATPTTIATISTLADNATNIIEVYIKGYQASATQYGVWKRTLTVTKVSGTPTIQSVDSDVTKTSAGLKATSVTFSVSGGNILVQVTGIAATTISWKSAYEIIL